MPDQFTIAKIKQLQAASRCLEPDELALQDWHATICKYSNDFLKNLNTSPVIKKQHLTDLKTIFDIDKNYNFHEALNIFNKYIVNNGIDTASSRYLAFIPGGGIPLSAYADYLAALTNVYAGNVITAPGAVQMEHAMIKWMSGIVGFPESASGNLSSGGSYANMIALITAREAFDIKARDIEKTVIYITDHTHHSITKCLRAIGLKEVILRHIAVDAAYKMNATVLQETIKKDRKQGYIPFIIIATAGTTDTGSIDPLDEIATIATQEKLWLHIDAAYGGFFKLTDTCTKKLAALSLADSITLDPHKGLFLPYGVGTILIKDATLQRNAFLSTANYMQDIVNAPDDWSPSDMSPELTKHFRALRMWLPLAHYGIEPFRSALNEKLLLTELFYNKLKNIPRIHIACHPELSIVAFRYLPENGDFEKFNKKLLEQINKDKRIFLSSTKLNGHYFIRMACLSFRTHLNDINLTLELINKSIAKLIAYA